MKKTFLILAISGLFGLFALSLPAFSEQIPGKQPAIQSAQEAEYPPNKWGFIDEQGNFTIEPQYDFIWQSFFKGLAGVYSNKTYKMIDRNNNIISEFEAVSVDKFSEGLARAKSGNKYGFINFKGEFVIPPQYVDAGHFQNGLASVYVDGKWGYINMKNEMVIEPTFNTVRPFNRV